MDFETTNSYTLTIEVSDGTFTVPITATLTVTDVNEPPSFTNLPDTISLPENTEIIGVIFTVTYTDEDFGDAVNASILSTNPDTNAFACSSTGNVQQGKLHY